MRECNGQFFLFMENAEIALVLYTVGLINHISEREFFLFGLFGSSGQKKSQSNLFFVTF